MKTSVTLIIIIFAFVVSLYGNFPLSIFYALLACSVLAIGILSNSLLYPVLGFVLFSRYCLESYEYTWSPIYVLATGHFLFAVITYLLVKESKNRFLLYFPALMLTQAFADITLGNGFAYYHHVHNTLAIMQMSVFMVLVWKTRSQPVEDDPIKDLIDHWRMVMVRDWPHWKKRLTS